MDETPGIWLGVALIVLSAGCGGLAIGDLGKKTPPSSKTYTYSELSPESQEAFQELLEEKHFSKSEQVFGPEISSHRYNTFYIEYQGQYYEIDHQLRIQDNIVCLQGLKPVTPADLGNGSKVADYPMLGSEGKQLFDAYRSGEKTDSCYAPEAYPLTEYSHIRKDGQLYRLNELQGSTNTYWYSLSKYSPTQ